MMDVRFKIHPPVGGSGQWTHAPLPEFLASLPYFLLLGGHEQPVPPIAVVNDVCKQGKWEAGMSGACEWKPFEIQQADYDELVPVLRAHPEYRFVSDESMAQIKSLRQWQGRVLSKYGRRAREKKS